MFGGSILLYFGERKKLLKYGTNQLLQCLVCFGLQKITWSSKSQYS